MLWRRPDGDLVRGVPPTKAIMPYLMRGRNESAVYFEQQVAMRKADAFTREFNEAHIDTPINVQHLLMWAITKVLDQYPTMNRFVVGGRLYQRRGIWFTYSAKQSLKGASPLIVLKRRFDPSESFEEMVEAMAGQLHDDRYGGGLSRSDNEAALILKLPGLARRVVLAIGRFGDAFGLLPGSMIEGDPLYASAFFANLASIGMDACYHHLYEYGSIGIFCVVGRATTDPGSPTSGPDRRRTMVLRWTFDERVEDGLVAGYALKRAKQILEDPWASMVPTAAPAGSPARAVSSP
ncbi:MAG: hypothetical protein WEB19_00645 [Acidimicrobiia bacterium]